MSNEHDDQTTFDRSSGSGDAQTMIERVSGGILHPFPDLPVDLNWILLSFPVAILVTVVDIFTPWFSLQELFMAIIIFPMVCSAVARVEEAWKNGNLSGRQIQLWTALSFSIVPVFIAHPLLTEGFDESPLPTVLWFDGAALIMFGLIVIAIGVYSVLAVFMFPLEKQPR